MEQEELRAQLAALRRAGGDSEARLVEAVGDGVAGRLVHRVRPKGATLLA